MKLGHYKSCARNLTLEETEKNPNLIWSEEETEKNPIPRWPECELGVDVFGRGGSIGIKQGPEVPIWFSPVGWQAGLLPDQMLRIIAAAEIPLPGWDLPLPDDWFDNPRRAVQVGQKRPLDVLRRFRELLEKTNSNLLYDFLKGGNTATTASDLRSRAKKLRTAATAFELPRAKRSVTSDLKKEFADARAALEGELLKWAERFDFWARTIGERKVKPLLTLMPALVTCFEQLFERRAATHWKPSSKSHVDEPAGPFIRFASAFLQEIDCTYPATTIHTDLYHYRKSQK